MRFENCLQINGLTVTIWKIFESEKTIENHL